MPYIKSVCKAGATIETELYYTRKYHPEGMRGEKKQGTPLAQEKVNLRQAEKKLRRLLNANFVYGDFHLILTYRQSDEPRTPEQMNEDIKKFLRKLRAQFKKENKELKYVHVMEIGKRGARHHHLVINRIDPLIIQKCWPHGRTHESVLDENGQYARLAEYLIKETNKKLGSDEALQGKRWNCSRNLVRPQVKKRVVSEANMYRTEPKAKKGYYIDQDSVYHGICEFTGYAYMCFTQIKYSESELKRIELERRRERKKE